MDNFKKKFGENVRCYRKLAGLSREALAEKLGIAPNTVGYIERGAHAIHFGKIPIIAQALGIETYKLFIFTDIEENPNIDDIAKLIKTCSQKERKIIAKVIKSILSLK